MRAREFIIEGGWDSTVTQGTIVNPSVVKIALQVINKFADDFNIYLQKLGLGPIQVGHPTGSSAYYDVDPADKIYGDIDLQMIGPPTEHKSQGQFQAYWNNLAHDFITSTNPPYVSNGEKPGHPIIKFGPDQYVQVDLMWHEEKTRDWGRFRVTPERGIKGLLNGNMFSVLGELLNFSIQHAGVQLKVIDGKQVPFSKMKDTEIKTISINPKTFVYDILTYLGGVAVDPLLKQYPGVTTDDVKISSLVNAVKGLARSFESNGMYGKDPLTDFTNANDFLQKFWSRYQEKAMIDVNSKKRNKANTPEAKARAEEDVASILRGLAIVKNLFEH